MNFLAEWGRLMIAPVPWLYRGVKTLSDGPISVLFLLLVGIAGLTASAIFWQTYLPMPWWVLVLGVLSFVYFGLTAGLAWERSRGAAVEIGPIEYVPAEKTFFLRITNGEKTASLEVQINAIIGANEQRFLLGVGAIYVVAIGQYASNILREKEERHYPICKLSSSAKGNPCLTVSPQYISAPLVVSEDSPLGEQKPVQFRIIITSQHDAYGASPARKTFSVTFTFTKDSSLSSGYRISTE